MIYLLTAQEIKTNTSMGGNVDPDKFMHLLYDVQVLILEPTLGTKLYDKLCDEVDAGTVSGVYETLLNDYIIPSTVQYAFVQLVPFLRLRFVNNAVVIMNSEQSQAATYDDLKPLMDQALDMATFYRERLIDYINNNTASYPEYSNNTGADLSPSTSNYTQGLNVEFTYDDLRYKAFLSAIGANNLC